MRLISSRSTGSLSERSRRTSSSVSVSGVSARNFAQCSAVKMRYGEYFSPGVSWSIRVMLRSSRRSASTAGGLLGKARPAGARFQLGHDLVERNARQAEHDEPVIDQVGAFGDDGGAVAAHGG